MTPGPADDPAAHRRHTRDAYDRLAPVWSDTTDDGPFNGGLERPALRALVPRPLAGRVVVDAACGSGAQCEWLADQGAEVIGFDLSPKMIDEAARRCGGRATFHVADLAGPLPIASDSVDGITCSLALHYLDDWGTALASFARILRPQGWCVLSSDHPSGPRLPGQRGGYFDRELVTDRWVKDGVDVVQHFWRRPLSQTVDAFADAGFVVDRIAEPQPSAEALARFPGELAAVVGTPWFAVYRLLLR